MTVASWAGRFELLVRDSYARTSSQASWDRKEPLPPTDIVEHEHTCPDGTRVVARSQYISTVGNTLDRWWLGGEWVGTSGRAGRNGVPPSFEWADARCPAV